MEWSYRIISSHYPTFRSEAKRAGRSIQLRKDWEQIKVSVMADIVKAKFEQNSDLAQKLLATGDAYLEEGNDWGDRIWGTVNGQGANCLGNILMDIREQMNNTNCSTCVMQAARKHLKI